MFNFEQFLREGMLEVTKGKPVQERADALNLLESIIAEDMTVEDLVEAISNGTVPVRYVPNA